MILAEAQKKYPDWNPDNPNKKWNIKGQKGHKGDELYQWWIRQIKEKAIVGGRYYSILALAAYGSKCDIPLTQVEKDAMELFPYLEELTNDETNHFKKSDVKDALRFYRENRAEITYRLTRHRISELTKIDIPENKRNGRKQATHLRIARATLEIMNEEEGETLQGRPSKQEMVQGWRKDNPNGTKYQCTKETGLSKNTVKKWW